MGRVGETQSLAMEYGAHFGDTGFPEIHYLLSRPLFVLDVYRTDRFSEAGDKLMPEAT